MFYPLSVALVPAFVSGSFVFSFPVLLSWVCFGKPVYSFLFLELLFHALYCFRAFVSSCFCMPPWPSVAFFSFRNLSYVKKSLVLVLLHTFSTSLGYLLLRGVSSAVPPV